jgi:hypothetical protein
MKRALAVLLVVALASGVVACSSAAPKPSATGSSTGNSTGSSAADPYAPIATDGAHETAALDAVPAALANVTTVNKGQGKSTSDVAGATPTLFAYNLQATVGDRLVLFEVHADGKACELFRFPTPADPTKLLWQSTANNAGAVLGAPQGEGETAATAAVKAVMDVAASGKTAQIKMSGYAFCFVRDGQPVKTSNDQVFYLSVDPKGNPTSWSQ